MKSINNKQSNDFLYILFPLICIIAILYYINFFLANGYLPSPFFYDKSDTFMDFFNPMHWAHEDERYTHWGSVYPPLNFILLKVMNLLFNAGRHTSAELARNISTPLLVGIFLLYVTMPAVVMMSSDWRCFKISQRAVVYFSAILSTPFLFAFERGNLIILAVPLLGFMLSSSLTTRVVLIAFLINIKAYFALLLIHYLIRRDWAKFFQCILFTGLIFILSGLALDSNFYLFFRNIFYLSQHESIFSLREVMSMPSSISAYCYVLKNHSVFALISTHMNISTTMVSYLISSLDTLKWMSLSASLAVITMKSHLIRDAEILALLVIIVSNLGILVGGYTMVFYIALIPVFLKMNSRPILLGLVALIYAPVDLVPLMKESIGIQYSYLSDSYVHVDWTLGLGAFIRPILNLILLLTVSFEFFRRSSDFKPILM